MTELLIKKHDIDIFLSAILLLVTTKNFNNQYNNRLSSDLIKTTNILPDYINKWSFIIMCHGYIDIFQSSINYISQQHYNNNEIDMNCILLVNESVPHIDMFRSCATVIHHGGVGTTGTCMLIGIPQSTAVTYTYYIYLDIICIYILMLIFIYNNNINYSSDTYHV